MLSRRDRQTVLNDIFSLLLLAASCNDTICFHFYSHRNRTEHKAANIQSSFECPPRSLENSSWRLVKEINVFKLFKLCFCMMSCYFCVCFSTFQWQTEPISSFPRKIWRILENVRWLKTFAQHCSVDVSTRGFSIFKVASVFIIILTYSITAFIHKSVISIMDTFSIMWVWRDAVHYWTTVWAFVDLLGSGGAMLKFIWWIFKSVSVFIYLNQSCIFCGRPL